MGDANLDLTTPSDSKSLEYVKKMNNLNLIQLVRSPTRIYKSILDHIWISNNDTIRTHSVRTTYYSDHMPLLLDIA